MGLHASFFLRQGKIGRGMRGKICGSIFSTCFLLENICWRCAPDFFPSKKKLVACKKSTMEYFLPVFFSKIYAEDACCPIFWREKCPLGFFSPKILYGSYFSSVWGSVFDLWNIFWLLMEPRASSGLVPVALICIFHNEKLHYGHLIKGKISLFLRPRRVILLRKQYATGRPHKIFISHFHFF